MVCAGGSACSISNSWQRAAECCCLAFAMIPFIFFLLWIFSFFKFLHISTEGAVVGALDADDYNQTASATFSPNEFARLLKILSVCFCNNSPIVHVHTQPQQFIYNCKAEILQTGTTHLLINSWELNQWPSYHFKARSTVSVLRLGLSYVGWEVSRLICPFVLVPIQCSGVAR